MFLRVRQRDAKDELFLWTQGPTYLPARDGAEFVPRAGDAINLWYDNADATSLIARVEEATWSSESVSTFSSFSLNLGLSCETLTPRQLVFLTTEPWEQL
jgi:hypothetical protein